MKKSVFLLSVFFAFSAVLPAAEKAGIVRETDESLVYRERNGAETKLKKNPKRVIICYASVAGVWLLAGGQIMAVAAADKEIFPEAAKNLPSVGAFGSPNMELIVSMKPDLVIMMERVEKHRAAREILNNNKIDNVLLDYYNYSDFLSLLDLFSRLNGNAAAKNEKAAKVTGDVKILTDKAEKLGKGPRFLTVFISGRGISCETPLASTSKMAEMLGGQNVISGGKDINIKFSLERLVMEDPDIIFFVTMGDAETGRKKMSESVMAEEAWNTLKAVKTGRVHFLQKDLFLYRPNERYPEAFKILAKLLWPSEKWE